MGMGFEYIIKYPNPGENCEILENIERAVRGISKEGSL
jgi:hypothetical protein